MADAQEDSPLYSIAFAMNVLGHGLTAHCFFPDSREVPVRAGDLIEFIQPDKSVIRTKVRAISLVKDAQPGLLVGLVLPDEVQRDDLTLETKLRLVRPGGTDEN